MKQSIGNLIRATIAIAILQAPAAAVASTAQLEITGTKTYETTFVKDYGPSVPITGGILRLTLTKEGYINGYFTPPDTATFIPVVGGRNGVTVWFDIGSSARTTHITGTLEGNQIVGYASEPNGADYRFTAVPAPAPG